MEFLCSRSPSATCLAIIFLSIVVSQVQSHAQTTQEWIEDICMHTYVQAEYVFCSKTFNQHLKSPDTDLVSLAQITIEQSLHNATNTHNLVLGLLKDVTGPAPLKDALVTCDSSYKTLVESFQRASAYFSHKDYQKVIVAESPGSVAQDKCYKSLTGAPRSSPVDSLVESNSQMRILVSMSLVTAEYLVSP